MPEDRGRRGAVPVFCNACGRRSGAREVLCSSCGGVLALAQPTAEHAVDPDALDGVGPDVNLPRERRAALVVTRGPVAGARFHVGHGVVTLGRDPSSAVFLDDVTVSRRHAEIVVVAGRFVIRDLGSLNGTYLNGARVDEAGLRHGDALQVGAYRMVFVAGEDAPQGRPAGTSGSSGLEAPRSVGPEGASPGQGHDGAGLLGPLGARRGRLLVLAALVLLVLLVVVMR